MTSVTYQQVLITCSVHKTKTGKRNSCGNKDTKMLKLLNIVLLSCLSFQEVTSQLYSFKCGTDTFLCGGLTKDQVCSNAGTGNNGEYISGADCTAMIAATKTANPYGAKCPNRRGISHYVVYSCSDSNGYKYEPGVNGDKCTCPSGTCGPTARCKGATVGGDPHFRTHDGTLYSFHGECDLVMARSATFGDGLGLDVHARTEIIGGTWSLVSNAAVRIGQDVFELANKGKHYLNGVSGVDFPALMAGRYQISYKEETVESEGDDGAVSTFIRAWYTIRLENEEKITITNFRSMISINVDANLNDTAGMLGSSVKEGKVGRDGVTVIENEDDMGLEWQVQNVEPMLFHEVRAPQYPEKCMLPVASSRRRRLRQSDSAYQHAKYACAGVNGGLQAFCVDDVLMSGDIAAAKSYGIVF